MRWLRAEPEPIKPRAAGKHRTATPLTHLPALEAALDDVHAAKAALRQRARHRLGGAAAVAVQQQQAVAARQPLERRNLQRRDLRGHRGEGGRWWESSVKSSLLPRAVAWHAAASAQTARPCGAHAVRPRPPPPPPPRARPRTLTSKSVAERSWERILRSSIEAYSRSISLPGGRGEGRSSRVGAAAGWAAAAGAGSGWRRVDP